MARPTPSARTAARARTVTGRAGSARPWITRRAARACGAAIAIFTPRTRAQSITVSWSASCAPPAAAGPTLSGGVAL